MNKSFDGCLNNFMINGAPIGTPAEEIGLIPCSKKIEPGIFFYPSSNGSNYFKPGWCQFYVHQFISKNLI